MNFRHSETKYVVSCNYPFLWTFLFGPFYFLGKGNYKHAIICGVILLGSIPVIGQPGIIVNCAVWFIYPFFAKGIMTNFYLEKGYKHLESFSTDL